MGAGNQRFQSLSLTLTRLFYRYLPFNKKAIVLNFPKATQSLTKIDAHLLK